MTTLESGQLKVSVDRTFDDEVMALMADGPSGEQDFDVDFDVDSDL